MPSTSPLDRAAQDATKRISREHYPFPCKHCGEIIREAMEQLLREVVDEAGYLVLGHGLSDKLRYGLLRWAGLKVKAVK